LTLATPKIPDASAFEIGIRIRQVLENRPSASLRAVEAAVPTPLTRCFLCCGLAAGFPSPRSAASSPRPPHPAPVREVPRSTRRRWPRRGHEQRPQRGQRRTGRCKTSTGAAAPTGRPPPTSSSPCLPSARNLGEHHATGISPS
jgi:hypothetical protein